jgi:hypothetical protein
MKNDWPLKKLHRAESKLLVEGVSLLVEVEDQVLLQQEG